ncbi:MAG TPA: response regulator [Candidatus Acidoferrum sp.]|nr:response regulator [Candidatus Acidoferrum sp.]
MVSVLIADDSAYIRDLLKTILFESGHDVVGEASNGDEVIVQFKKLKPDVVLLDIVMKEGNIAKNGLEALKEIMAENAEANVIVCSALNEETLINESMKTGAKAFVAKPFEPEKLLETIVMCTDLRIFSEIGNIGVGHAATVLSKLCNQPINISLPKLETGPPHLAARLCGAPDRQVTAIHMQLFKEPNCDILIVFDPQDAKKIADILTQKSTSFLRSEMYKSALEEMGSIMICAFFSAIANFAEMRILPSAPEVITDYFEAVIDSFLAKQMSAAKSAFIFEMSFKQDKNSVGGYFLVIPSPDFVEQLIKAGKRWVGNSNSPMQSEILPSESLSY